MDIILVVLHVVLSLGIITLVLLQKGAGASAGAAFGGGGGGGGGSVFGATGASNFLSKTTGILATAFFLNSLALAYLASHRDMETDTMLDQLSQPAVVEPQSEVLMPADLDVPAPAALEVPAESEKTLENGVPAPASE